MKARGSRRESLVAQRFGEEDQALEPPCVPSGQTFKLKPQSQARRQSGHRCVCQCQAVGARPRHSLGAVGAHHILKELGYGHLCGTRAQLGCGRRWRLGGRLLHGGRRRRRRRRGTAPPAGVCNPRSTHVGDTALRDAPATHTLNAGCCHARSNGITLRLHAVRPSTERRIHGHRRELPQALTPCRTACGYSAARPEHTRHASAPSKFLCDYAPAMWPPTARRDCGQRRGAQRSTSPQRGTRHVGPASQQDAAGRHAADPPRASHRRGETVASRTGEWA